MRRDAFTGGQRLLTIRGFFNQEIAHIGCPGFMAQLIIEVPFRWRKRAHALKFTFPITAWVQNDRDACRRRETGYDEARP